MSAVMSVYNRSNLTFERGEGVYLFSPDGTQYLDFAAGIAVNALGHGHPTVVEALKSQADKLWHISNLYEIPGLNEFAQTLVDNSFADKVFFCNSGAEAVECGIKMIRKYHHETGTPQKYKIIAFTEAFHGRTLATISAAGSEKNIKGFEPILPGFIQVEYGNLDAVKNVIDEETAGILVEPIQGEGGIIVPPEGFISGLKSLCDEHGLLLMLDEVQAGMGRTGKLFAHEWCNISPDIVSSAKGIGNGFPLGACFATDNAAQGMKPGTHGSTYGSNPLAMAVGNAVLSVILSNNFLDNVNNVAEYLDKELAGLKQSFPEIIEEIRGFGLMKGIKCSVDANNVVTHLREEKLLTVPAANNVVRLLPPLIITEEHVKEAVEKLRNGFRNINHD